MEEELSQIQTLMRECESLEERLADAHLRRTQLATRLYGEHGPERTYMVGGEELLISRTKPRKDGSVSYFFAAKHRWAKKQGVRAAINEAFEGLERAGLTGRVIEATAVLDGRAQAGDERPETQEHPRVPGMVCGDLTCSVCLAEREGDDMDIQAGGRGMSLEEAVARYPDLEFLLRGFEPDPEDAPAAKPQRAKRKGAGVPDAERPPEASQEADLGSIMDDLGLDD